MGRTKFEVDPSRIFLVTVQGAGHFEHKRLRREQADPLAEEQKGIAARCGGPGRLREEQLQEVDRFSGACGGRWDRRGGGGRGVSAFARALRVAPENEARSLRVASGVL